MARRGYSVGEALHADKRHWKTEIVVGSLEMLSGCHQRSGDRSPRGGRRDVDQRRRGSSPGPVARPCIGAKWVEPDTGAPPPSSGKLE